MKKYFLSILIVFVFVTGGTGCSTVGSSRESSLESRSDNEFSPKLTDSEYNNLVKQFSDRAELYEGFSNIFQVQGSLLNQKVLEAQLDKKISSFNWDLEKRLKEQKKLDESVNSETTVFLSFYSPENKIDNLGSASSVWRVFLDVNNKRYVGKVVKYLGFVNEPFIFFPYHTRFATGYLVKFPVPIIHVQDYETKITLTGAVGSKSLTFKSLVSR